MTLRYRVAKLEERRPQAGGVLVAFPEDRPTDEVVQEHCARTGMSESDLLVIEVAFVEAR